MPLSSDIETHEQPEQPTHHHLWWHTPVAGLIGGTAGGFINYPFEALKKLKQQYPHARLLNPLGRTQQPASATNLPRFWKRGELGLLYKGAPAFAFSLAPVSMVQWSALALLKKIVPDKDVPQAAAPYWPYLRGITSGAMGALISAPVEHIILIQQQLAKRNEVEKLKLPSGPLTAAKQLLQKGYSHPWTALKPLAIRESIFGFTMLMGAKDFGEWLSTKYSTDLNLVGGIGVGWLGATISHPFDRLGTEKQMSPHIITMRKAATNIYHRKGLLGFFEGYSFRIFLFTGCMITINKFENQIELFLGKKHAVSQAGLFGAKEKAPQQTSISTPGVMTTKPGLFAQNASINPLATNKEPPQDAPQGPTTTIGRNA